MHIFGFNSFFYKFFQNEDLEFLEEANVAKAIEYENGDETHSTIKTDLVVYTAKQYFGCATITSIPLENEGGVGSMGSHWERSLMGDEIMTASDIYEASLSIFTLALL